MRRSYFIPILSLGIIMFFVGIFGISAARIALENYYEQRHPYVRKTVLNDDSETLLKSLGSEQALRYKNMRLHALSATCVGLVFVVWAFDRRSMYARLQNLRGEEVTGSWPKTKLQIRSIALCVLLLMFATGAVLQLRQIMPEWVNHVRTRSDRNKAASVRAFLESKGLPVAQIYWRRGGKGWKSVTLAGTQAKDISALAELPIAELKLIDTQVTDLNPLNKSALRSLSLVKSPVRDISPLVGTKIHFLNLIGTDVTDLQPLGRMPELRTISLSRQQVVDNMDVLRELDLVVKEVQGGPAFRTSDPDWQQEYESADDNSP